MMELKPSCECCDIDLPPESTNARMCTFECTYCATCADEMNGVCKNCFGNLVVRPIRPPEHLAKYPASTVRVFNPHNCPVHNPALPANERPSSRTGAR